MEQVCVCVNQLLFENNLDLDAIELLGRGPRSPSAFFALRAAEANRRHRRPTNLQTTIKLKDMECGECIHTG